MNDKARRTDAVERKQQIEEQLLFLFTRFIVDVSDSRDESLRRHPLIIDLMLDVERIERNSRS